MFNQFEHHLWPRRPRRTPAPWAAASAARASLLLVAPPCAPPPLAPALLLARLAAPRSASGARPAVVLVVRGARRRPCTVVARAPLGGGPLVAARYSRPQHHCSYYQH